MWLFTIFGFFSVVFKTEKKTDKKTGVTTKTNWVNVRTRVKGDLETLLTHWPVFAGPLPEILTTPDNDYPYRILITPSQWAMVAEVLAESVMDVVNFKDEVTKRQGKARHDVYLDVWRVLAKAFGTGWSLSKKASVWPRK